MFHEIIVELFVGSMDVMPITKFNTMFDADHINSVFPRQVSAITFFDQGSTDDHDGGTDAFWWLRS
jgi:hypothetical protein